MAIRSRAVRPDAVLETAVGAIPHVSDEAFIRAVVDAATTMALVGGELRVVVQRVPTEFANEALTAAALIEWRNHTDAKPQPEPMVQRGFEDGPDATDEEMAAALAEDEGRDEAEVEDLTAAR